MSKRKQLMLRLDPRLWEEIQAWAAQDLRSVNGQIEYLLREAVRQRRRQDPAAKTKIIPRALRDDDRDER